MLNGKTTVLNIWIKKKYFSPGISVRKKKLLVLLSEMFQHLNYNPRASCCCQRLNKTNSGGKKATFSFFFFLNNNNEIIVGHLDGEVPAAAQEATAELLLVPTGAYGDIGLGTEL